MILVICQSYLSAFEYDLFRAVIVKVRTVSVFEMDGQLELHYSFST